MSRFLQESESESDAERAVINGQGQLDYILDQLRAKEQGLEVDAEKHVSFINN